MARALIVGGDGLIGGMLVRSFSAHGWEVIATTRRRSAASSNIHLDLSDPQAPGAPLPAADVAIFAAAMTGFADCRAAPERARAVNVDVPVALAERLARLGTRSVLISSNAVFDGSRPRQSADTPPAPTSLYGALKVDAERGFLALSTGSVVRLTKVLDPNHALFTRWRVALMRNERIGAFSDLRLAPIALSDVETAILTAATGGGILQVSASEDMTYYAAALHLARALGKPETSVAKQSSVDAGIPEGDRPLYTSLDSTELATRTGWTPPLPQDVITSVFVGSRGT
jgi:dTDP-4-dehydrorhamnose reductase